MALGVSMTFGMVQCQAFCQLEGWGPHPYIALFPRQEGPCMAGNKANPYMEWFIILWKPHPPIQARH